MRVTGVGTVTSAQGITYWTQEFGSEVISSDVAETPSPSEDPGDGSDPGDGGDPGDGDSPDAAPVPGEPDNTAPVAVDDRRRVRAGQRVKVVVLANDYDVDGDPLTLTKIVASPRYGRAIFDPTDGTIRYRARRGTAGRRDRLTYRISDGNGGVSEAIVRFRIVR